LPESVKVDRTHAGHRSCPHRGLGRFGGTVAALELAWPIQLAAFTLLGFGFYTLHGSIQVQRRFENGIGFTANYTLSRYKTNRNGRATLRLGAQVYNVTNTPRFSLGTASAPGRVGPRGPPRAAEAPRGASRR